VTDEQRDPLERRLRAADPASTLAPAGPDRVQRLLEDVMSTELTTENRATGARHRGPLTWAVAAAAVVLIAGVALFGVLRHDDTPATPPTASDARTVTELSAPPAAAYSARCMVPTSAVLARQTVAVDATVTTIAGGVVTLTPSHWYAGDPTDLVRVQAPPQDLQALLGAVRFQEGGRYLVAASGGQVAVCGFSGPWSSRLASLYADAFPG
jgi:hypothetical protein